MSSIKVQKSSEKRQELENLIQTAKRQHAEQELKA
jgi:hypothetical protein